MGYQLLTPVSSHLTTKPPSRFYQEMLRLLLLVLPLLCTEAVNVQDSFAESGLVKDLKILAPEKQLEVSYPGLFPLAPGDSLAESEAKKIPSIRLEEASKEQLFTVAMVDPDAPSRKNPRAAQWLHWILTNVQGLLLSLGTGGSPEIRDYSTNDGMKMLLGSGPSTVGDEVMSYAGPAPPKGSGPHRYVLLAWKQQQNVSMKSPHNRARGDILKIAKDLNLGQPVAGNFFFAEDKR